MPRSRSGRPSKAGSSHPGMLGIKLDAEDRARLERLCADSGAVYGWPVTLSDVVRHLIREAYARGTPMRVRDDQTPLAPKAEPGYE